MTAIAEVIMLPSHIFKTMRRYSPGYYQEETIIPRPSNIPSKNHLMDDENLASKLDFTSQVTWISWISQKIFSLLHQNYQPATPRLPKQSLLFTFWRRLLWGKLSRLAVHRCYRIVECRRHCIVDYCTLFCCIANTHHPVLVACCVRVRRGHACSTPGNVREWSSRNKSYFINLWGLNSYQIIDIT